MSIPSFLYQGTHENNRIFVSAKKSYTHYADTNAQALLPQFIIACELIHRVLPYTPYDHDPIEERQLLHEFCSAPHFFFSADQSRPLISTFLSSAPIPFDLDGHGNQLRWGYDDDEVGSEALRGGAADVAAKISEVAEMVAGEISSSERPVLAVEIRVTFTKLTVLNDDVFREVFDPDHVVDDDSDDGGDVSYGGDVVDDNEVETNRVHEAFYRVHVAITEDLEWQWDQDSNNDDWYDDVAVESTKEVTFETVVHGVDAAEVTCTVCMDDVVVGAHLAKLACGHMFHGDCIDPWLKNKTTCPVCRFDLAK